jgi:hypothetical protein
MGTTGSLLAVVPAIAGSGRWPPDHEAIKTVMLRHGLTPAASPA